MFRNLIITMLSLLLFANVSFATPGAGDPAPEFSATDINGKTHSLSQYKGKLLVLEWSSSVCPFVKKHYSSHHMQDLQKKYTAKGVIWLTIDSSGEGRPGFMTTEEALALEKERDAAPSGYILDTEGTIGKAFGAKATPHMFVINTDGKVAYMGAIDDNDSTDPEDIKTATNYVSRALDALMKKKPAPVPDPLVTDPYGCAVKYKR